MEPIEIDREPNSNILRGDWFIALWADSYAPEHAQLVCETISEQSELTIGVMINLACDAAWRETIWN